MQRAVMIIVGTRPEGIKMMPVYFALKRAGLPVVLVSTMQHGQLLDDVFDLFNMRPDYDFGIMRQGQDLFYLTQILLQKMKTLLHELQPALVLVQGDTTSTFAAALSAFYAHIPIMHVEAGLRTGDISAPYPEEFNRCCVSLLARHHFAPTAGAAAHLLVEGVADSAISVVGNTVVDALFMVRDLLKQEVVQPLSRLHSLIETARAHGKRVMLFTMHRRESFDGGVDRVLTTLKTFLEQHTDVVCIYPYHPNPYVVDALQKSAIKDLTNCCLFEPLAYVDMVYLLLHADSVVTDSGGIQEEAVSLGKPTIVLREKTERMEGVVAGIAHLVGTSDMQLLYATLKDVYQQPGVSHTHTLYGDGKAAEKIVEHIQKVYAHTKLKQKSEQHEQTESALYVPTVQLKRNMMRIAMLGLGYIGLPTALIMAEKGCEVIGVDIDVARVAAINQGNAVIQEPEIYERLQIALQGDNFKAVTTLCAADYYIIAVPTPFKEQKKADLQYVYAAVDMIVPVLKEGDTILVESTIPVGTTDAVAAYIAQQTDLIVGTQVYIAHCPERVLPGNIFYELVHNDRIIGGINEASAQKARQLYAQFVQGTLYTTDAKSAELVKLIENSSRDVQIAFAHQVASMAYQIDRDPYQIIALANRHPRVQILQPSAGVGGHCIAVDPWFLVETFPEQTTLLHAARTVNDARPLEIMTYINQAVHECIQQMERKPRVLLMGLTYKADVDDLRESPALHIAHLLKADTRIELSLCEPHVKQIQLKGLFQDAVVSINTGIEQADIIVFLVAHNRFKAIDNTVLSMKKVFDFCGVLHQRAQESTDCWPQHSAACMTFKQEGL